MCPCECPGLADRYGEEFEKLYEYYEKEGRGRKSINASPQMPDRCKGKHCRQRHDVYGDHPAACMLSGHVQRRAKPVEKMFARILSEAGATVLDKHKIADMELPGARTGDNRQIEIVAKNLRLKRGIPLACDATLVSPLRANGEAKPRTANHDGAAITEIERVKRRTYPELLTSSRCRLVVLAGEVGGRWSDTCV